MMQVGGSALLKGLATYVPGIRSYCCSGSGGTVSARYCYSVWMRHLTKAYESGLASRLDSLVELGPGDSLGIGLCAVLCGVSRYYAFDAKPHAQSVLNTNVLRELARLLAQREPIPGDTEFPRLSPRLSDYSFPHHILTKEVLERSLSPNRIGQIERALLEQGEAGGISIVYYAPWYDGSTYVPTGNIAMVISQAVMEHVEDIEGTYAALHRWLRPRGCMSHTIDYKSHEHARGWNGHWTIPDPVWRVVKGRRPYLINRQPHSRHIEAIERAGFRVITELKKRDEPLRREMLANGLQWLTDDDLGTAGAFVQAVKVSESNSE